MDLVYRLYLCEFKNSSFPEKEKQLKFTSRVVTKMELFHTDGLYLWYHYLSRKEKTAKYKEHFSEFDNFGNENQFVCANIEYTRPCANRQSASVENKTTTTTTTSFCVSFAYTSSVYVTTSAQCYEID